MGRNPWDSDADVQAMRGGGSRLGTIFLALLVIAAATFGLAFYLPLFRAHEALLVEHRKAADELRGVAQSLTSARAETQSVTAQRDALEREQKARAASTQGASGELESVQRELATKLEKQLKKGSSALAVADGHVALAVADKFLFAPQKSELSSAGRALLCEAAKAGGTRPLRVVTVLGEGKALAAPAPKPDSPWALDAARAAAVAAALQKDCAVPATRLTLTTVSAAPSPDPFGVPAPSGRLEL